MLRVHRRGYLRLSLSVASDHTSTMAKYDLNDAAVAFTRVHRSGLIACVYRAAEWRHKKVEVAAHELLQELDRTAGIE